MGRFPFSKMRVFFLFIIGLLGVCVHCLEDRDRFAQVEDITDGNCGIDLDKLKEHREADNWKDVVQKTRMTLTQCEVTDFGPGAICFLGKSDDAMDKVREKMKTAQTDIETLWTSGECETMDDSGDKRKFPFISCKKEQPKMLRVAQMAGMHIKKAAESEQADTKCDLIKQKKALFKSILACVPRTLAEELFGSKSGCEASVTADDMVSFAEQLDRKTIRRQLNDLQNKESDKIPSADTVKKVGISPEILKEFPKKYREKVSELPDDEKFALLKEALIKKKQKRLEEEEEVDMTKSKKERKREKKSRSESSEEVMDAVKQKEMIGPVSDTSEDMMGAMLKDPSIMLTTSPKESQDFSVSVVCNSDDDTDPLEDSPEQVQKRMTPKCKGTDAESMKGSFVRNSKPDDLDKMLEESDNQGKEAIISKCSQDQTLASPKQRRVMRNHTETLVSGLQSFDVTKIENLIAGLVEMDFETEVMVKLTTLDAKMAFCRKMKDVNIEDETKMEPILDFCLNVEGMKPIELGEVICQMTADKITNMEIAKVYEGMENLCRYTCTRDAKVAIVNRIKEYIGMDNFLAGDLSALATCFIAASEEDKEAFKQHGKLYEAYEGILNALEGFGEYCARRSCELADDVLASLGPGGFVEAAMVASLESSSTTDSTRRRKRALREVDPATITCDNIDKHKMTLKLLTVPQIGELSDALYLECPVSLGSIPGLSSDQLKPLADGLKKHYTEAWTEDNLLDFRVVLLGVDTETIATLALTLDVMAQVGSVAAQLTDNTKYEELFNKWAAVAGVQEADLTGHQLSMLQMTVCGITATKMADILPDSYEGASTVVGRLMCLTDDQCTALGMKARTVYGENADAYNADSSLLADLGVVSGCLGEGILSDLDSEAIPDLPPPAIAKLPQAVFAAWPNDVYETLTKAQAQAISMNQFEQLTDEIKERVEHRRMGKEWTGVREPIKEQDELPKKPLAQICSMDDLDDVTLESLEKIQAADDDNWNWELLCDDLFADVDALKMLSRLDNPIIARIVQMKLKKITPTANDCSLHGAACWALDDRTVKALTSDVARCIATDDKCCQKEKGACQPIAKNAWPSKLFSFTADDSKVDIRTRLTDYCCWQDMASSTQIKSIFEKYGQHDDQFDTAVDCDCSNQHMKREASKRGWKTMQSPKDLTKEEKTEFVQDLGPEEASNLNPQDIKHFDMAQAIILLEKTKEARSQETAVAESEGKPEKLKATDVNTLILAKKVLDNTTFGELAEDTRCHLLSLGAVTAKEIKQTEPGDLCPLLENCYPTDEYNKARGTAVFKKCKSSNPDLKTNNAIIKNADPKDLEDTLSDKDTISDTIDSMFSGKTEQDMLTTQLVVLTKKVDEILSENEEILNDQEKMVKLAPSLAFKSDLGEKILDKVVSKVTKKEMCYKLACPEFIILSSSNLQGLLDRCLGDLEQSMTKMVCTEEPDVITMVFFFTEQVFDQIYTADELKAALSSLQLKVGSCASRRKIAEKVFPTLNLTDPNQLLELSTLVDQLSEQQWSSIPQSALCDMLEKYSTDSVAQKEHVKKREKNGFKSGTNSLTECFGESEVRLATRRRLREAYVSDACTVAEGTRRRRRRSTVTLTCEVIEILGEDVSTSSLDELDSLSDADFEACLETLGSVSSFSPDQWTVLAGQAMEVYGGVDTWTDTYVLKSLAGIISGLSAENLGMLVLDDLSVLQAIGLNGDWTDDEKVMAAFGQFLAHHPDVSEGVSAITSTHLVAMGYLACGMTSEQIAMLDSDEFCDAVETVGQLDNCEDSQVTEFAKHAKVCFGDDVSTWSSSDVTAMGMIIGGLGEDDLQMLTETHINMIEPVNIAAIPNTAIDGFTTTQLGYLSVNQVGSLTSSQLGSLSEEQLQVIKDALDGLDDVDLPEVGDDDAMDGDSGCGVLESSVISLLPLLLAFFCTL